MTQVISFESLDSTMDEARRRAFNDAEEGIVIVARTQTHGRGRRGRVWDSQIGNIMLTYVTYAACPLSHGTQLSFVACVAVSKALEPYLPPGHVISHKWPNDILLNHKKVGGNLIEAVSSKDTKQMTYLMGCGVNLVSHPSQTVYPATSFQEEGIFIPYEEGVHAIVNSIKTYLKKWEEEGFEGIKELWLEKGPRLGEPLSWASEGVTYSGGFKGIDETGALLLETPEETLRLTSGEIVEVATLGQKNLTISSC